MLKVLTQYYEATGDKRVIPLMSRYADHHLRNAKAKPLTEWAKYRWGDEVLGMIWLYNRTGDEKLLDLSRLMHEQGFDWREFFDDFKFKEKTSHEMLGLNKQLTNNTEVALSVHGVNNGMALKTETLWSQISNDAGDRNASLKMLETLERYHGLPNGMFSGDEHLAGTHPSQGVETCAVVETLFSLEQLISLTGDVKHGMGCKMSRIFPAEEPVKPWRYFVATGHSVYNRGVGGLNPSANQIISNTKEGHPSVAFSRWLRGL
ncbi:MAG: beta-L-arabinofuranosidase domain-containing protein [Pyrinomonadaceae bacterium]